MDPCYFAPGTIWKTFKARYYHTDFEHDGLVHEVPAKLPDGHWAPHRLKGEKTKCGKDPQYMGFDILPSATPTTCPECLAASGKTP